MARGGKLVDTPAWAWGIKVDPTASPAALPDGWYLVSDDPGPKLRVAGPLKMQRACWQEILDSSDSFGIQTFRVVHLVHGKPVQSTGYDKAGQPLRTHQKDLPDGFYVMIKSAERDVWQTRMKLVAADRAVLAAKQRAAKARLVREGAKGSMAAAEKRQEDLAATEKRVHAGNTQNRARNTALGHSRGQLPGAPEEKAKSRPKEMLEVRGSRACWCCD
ncbi:hypothetical protein T484DRAFT_3155080 [Baffinella frigidus]|nr:hypothetical protein T484DRAFT_3155080 [Cryptophyta sp. CCMP2293]